MKITQLPFDIRQIVAVNLAIVAVATVAFVVMLLAGALGVADAPPAQTGISTQVASIVEYPEIEAAVSIDTQISSVTLVRGP